MATYQGAGTAPSGTGAGTASTGSVTPALPASLATTDLCIIGVGSKQDVRTVTTPTGWSLGGTVAGGGGTTATADAGPTRTTGFFREKDATWSTMPAIAFSGTTTNAAAWAQAFRFSKDNPAATWDIACAGGADSSADASWSATMDVNPGIASGDTLLWITTIPTDVTTPAQFASHNISIPGCTVGSITEISEPDTTQGSDAGGFICTATVTAGTATGVATITATASGTTTNVRGTTLLFRIREVVTGPSTQTLTASGIATEEAFPGGGGGSATKNILVVHDDPTPSANDTDLINYLTGVGHTVTTDSEVNTLPDIGYDCIIVTESGSSGSAAITSIPTCQLPVILFETTVNTARLSSAAMTTGGTAGQSWDMATHELNSGYPDPMEIFNASQSMYGVAESSLPAGVVPLAYAPGSTHVTAAIAETGATLTTGTAPARRAYMGLVSSRLTAAVQGISAAWFNDVIVWLGGGAGGGGGHTVTLVVPAITMSPGGIASAQAFGSPTAQALAPGAQGVSPTGIASAEAFPGGGGASNPNLPVLTGTIHVEPESHSYNPTVIDGNGNLYRVVESKLEATDPNDMNQPKMLKSTDGGETWVEQDMANRPGTDTDSVADLESACTTYSPVDKAITFTWQRSYPAYSRFFTSDHPTTPDVWEDNDREQVATASGSPQFASHTTPQDQSYEWVFFTDGSGSSYVSRPKGPDTAESGKTTIDSAGMSPAAILDSNNVSHIIFKKSSQLHYKKLTSSGTLDGASTRVDTNGVNAVAIPHTFPQAWVNGGTTYVGCLFADGSAILKFVLLTNGTPGSEETVSGSAVVLDPGATGGQGAVCSLAVDPVNGTMHAIWSQANNGDLMYSSRPHGGSWSTPTTLQNPAWTPAWVYAKVNTYPSTLRVLSYNYIQEVDDNRSDPWYGEVVLAGGGGGHTVEIVASTAVNMQPSAIASAQALGSPSITTLVGLVAQGIASGQALGTPTISTLVNLVTQGIASAQALGSPSLLARITLSPSGVGSAEALGTPSLLARITLSPSSVASLEAFGSPSLLAPLTLSPSAITSLEGVGTPSLMVKIPLSPTGIASAQLFGVPSVTTQVTMIAQGITSLEALGNPSAAAQTIVTVTGIASGESVSNPVVTTKVIMTATGIASLEAFGAAVLTPRITLVTSGIASAEAFGSPSLLARITLLAASIASLESVSAVTVTTRVTLLPTAISSGQEIGTPGVGSFAQMVPTSIASVESFGTTVITTRVTLSPTGLASAQALGTPSLAAGLNVVPVSIESLQAMGTPSLTARVTLSPTAIASAEVVAPAHSGSFVQLMPSSIASGFAFGSISVSLGAVGMRPDGIPSLEGLGQPEVSTRVIIIIPGIESGESFGVTAVYAQIPNPPTLVISPASIGSAAAFGLTFLTIDIGPEGDIVMIASLLARTKNAVILKRPKVAKLRPRGPVPVEPLDVP